MSISCSVPKPSNRCPLNDTKEEIKECYMLDGDCLKCDCAINCTYGENATANCVVPEEIEVKTLKCILIVKAVGNFRSEQPMHFHLNC